MKGKEMKTRAEHLLELYAEEQGRRDHMITNLREDLQKMQSGEMAYDFKSIIDELESEEAGRQARDTWGNSYDNNLAQKGIEHKFFFHDANIEITTYEVADIDAKPILVYHSDGTFNITKEMLKIISSLTNWREFTFKTNAGVDIHSAEMRNGVWNGITLERI